jgi:uncharacterized protein YjbJ (UPF0337 family)
VGVGGRALGHHLGMPDNDQSDRTRAGLFGDLAGKAKESVGELLGNDELAEHGREQQDEVAAEDRELRERQSDAG